MNVYQVLPYREGHTKKGRPVSKVLIVEDQPSMAAMVRHHVESAGFDVVTASDVDGAWNILLSENPEAAIVDIQLQGADGWDLLTKTRVDERTRHLPMVVLTGLHGREVRERVEAFGAEYFTKPFAASQLINRLRQMVHPTDLDPLSEIEVPETVEMLLTDIAMPLTDADLPQVEELHRTVPPPPAARPVERSTAHPELSPASREERPLDLVAVSVVLMLSEYQIEGRVHMPADTGRFSDAWEAMVESPRSYVPVTDAKVIFQGAAKSVATTPFLQVAKADIKGIFPVQ
jgi:CheY-like chemotaxis protein